MYIYSDESGAIWSQDGLPPTMSATRLGLFRLGGFEGCSIYAGSGEVLGIAPVGSVPRKTRLNVILANTLYNPVRHYRVRYYPKGRYALDDLKRRIRELVEQDPGDLLLQFLGADEINRHLNRATSFEDVFRLVRGMEGGWEAD